MPIYFVEVQFQKKPKFYSRLFAELFLYFYQYEPPHNEWYAIIIYRRRSLETPAPGRYRELMEHRVRRIYLDEIVQAGDASVGVGIVQLVVESKKNTGAIAQSAPAKLIARQLISKARQELPDANLQQQIIELIETVVLYKFPHLSREELEAMLGLSELRQTRVYQEALEEGRQEGLERGQLQAKLAMIPRLLQRGLSGHLLPLTQRV